MLEPLRAAALGQIMAKAIVANSANATVRGFASEIQLRTSELALSCFSYLNSDGLNVKYLQ